MNFKALEDNTTIALKTVGSLERISLLSSINCESWNSYDVGNYITLNKDDCVYLSGDNSSFSSDSSNYYYFTTSDKVEIHGNIMSLVSGSNLEKADTIPNDWCFYGLLSGSKITTAPELPATTLTSGCYSNMFKDCEFLSFTPGLPAIELKDYCYAHMFENCSSLSITPELVATKLADFCYYYMFAKCDSLITAPELLVEYLSASCYQGMFNGCSSLSSAPVLNSIHLASSCYNSMFTNCTFKNIPNLPAITLCGGCYAYMFKGCNSLIDENIILSATEFKESCYNEMFNGCSQIRQINIYADNLATSSCYEMLKGCEKLNYIYVNFKDWKDNLNSTTNWVSGVKPNGIFEKSFSLSSSFGNSYIPSGKANNTEWKWDIKSEFPLYFKALEDNTTIALNLVGFPNQISLLSSTDCESWDLYDVGTSITLNKDKCVYLSGDNSSFSLDSSKCYYFTTSNKVEAHGNIMSLVSGSNLEKADTIPNEHCFYRLLSGTNITTAPKLPATILKNGCYQGLFADCKSLSSAPVLPAIKLENDCYQGMFYGCTSLSSAPSLLTENLKNSCYQGMFYGCTSLSSAPALPAEYLSANCYQNMFYGCTSLSSVPILSSTHLASSCYESMFTGCNKIEKTKKLPATTLCNRCYAYMFKECSSLIDENIILPAAEFKENCYNEMFNGCTHIQQINIYADNLTTSSCYEMLKGCSSLKSISVNFKDWKDDLNSTTNWVSGVQSGLFSLKNSFKCPSDLTEKYGNSYIPSGENNNTKWTWNIFKK